MTSTKDGYFAGDNVMDLKQAWVVPGLIDKHTHVTMDMDLDSKNPNRRFHTGVSWAFSTTCFRHRCARLIGSEPQFETAGGDYAPFNFGGRADVEPLFKDRGTCSGATDCERAVRDEIRRGAGVIKMRLSATHLLVPGSGPTETRAELEAIVATAHRLNRKVATHSSGLSAANLLAIEAGTDTLKHGPVSDTDIAAMVVHRTANTPTLLAAKTAFESGAMGPMDFLRLPWKAFARFMQLRSVAVRFR